MWKGRWFHRYEALLLNTFYFAGLLSVLNVFSRVMVCFFWHDLRKELGNDMTGTNQKPYSGPKWSLRCLDVGLTCLKFTVLW